MAVAKAIQTRKAKNRMQKWSPRFRPGLDTETKTRIMNEIKKSHAWMSKALREVRSFAHDSEMVWHAAEIAARLRVPEERIIESIKEHGLEQTYGALKEIQKISLEMKMTRTDVQKMINQQGIIDAYAQLKQEYEQAMQTGRLAA